MSTDLRIKYDADVRRRAAELFERGCGRASVAKRLGVPAETVRKWLFTYRSVGLEGLLRMGSKHTGYSWETKCAAARAVAEGGSTVAEAMEAFGVASRSPLVKWVAAWREGGDEALRPRPKGRPKGTAAKAAPRTREQELEERVRKLEAQVAYLKKAAALKAGKGSRTGRSPR